MEPFRCAPLLVAKPWGGRRLADLGRDLPDDVLVGESWDVADLDPVRTSHPDPVSRVLDGPSAGRSLAEVIAVDGRALLGDVAPDDGRFPLLVKHLDACQHLSVQVHPPAELVVDRPDWALKTESWVVLRADPDAQLMLGLVDGTTPDDVTAAAGTPAIGDLLRRVPAGVGDVHHLPAGLVHALGAGVVVAEVQTPSDTTFRLHDWTEEYGRAPRDLHLEPALATIAATWDLNTIPRHPVAGDGEVVASPHYRITRHTATDAATSEVPVRAAARVVIVVDGTVAVGSLPPSGPGGVVVVPAAWDGEVAVDAGAVWLDVDLV